jgi:hypothetical protein
MGLTDRQLDEAEAWLVTQLRAARVAKDRGVLDHNQAVISTLLTLIRKQRKCRKGHSAWET